MPANLLWVGPANGNWSTATNWAPAQIPGNNDILTFDPAVNGQNTASNMDLGGGNIYHIAGLQIGQNYTKTITLQSTLWVDVLNMSGGTIAGQNQNQNLWITQVTAGQFPATNFAASTFSGGTIQVPFATAGEANHRVTLTLAGGNLTPDLEANLSTDQWTALEWRAGNMTVGSGFTITIGRGGTFLADSKGTIGNNKGWNLVNNGTFTQGKGTFNNVKITDNGTTYKQASAIQDGTPDTFVVIGDVTESNGAYAEVQSGTLNVQGDVTDSGSVVVDNGQTLDVTGNVDVLGGSLDNQGGTVEADSGLTVESGATLSGSGTIIGNLTNSGTLNVGETSAIGTLAITGGFLNSSSGVVNMEASASGVNDQIQVSGAASVAGTLNFTTLGGYNPGYDDAFALMSYGSLSVFSGTLNLPTLAPGYSWSINPSSPVTFSVV